MAKYHFIFVSLILLGGCSPKNDQGSSPITIDVWYGKEQKFGTPGLAQRCINILGNVKAEKGIASLTYRLNNGASKELTLGSDLHRLAATGDFNIDIHRSSLINGENKVTIEAKDSLGNQQRETVSVFFENNNKWPLPYEIKWSEVDNLQEVVQVTDGIWEITPEGLHNKDVYYDRIVALGDSTWKNYKVETTVTFHSMIPPSEGSPTYNISHAGIASRWLGHDTDELQPNRKWHPVGVFSFLRLTDAYDSCRWEMLDGEGLGVGQPIAAYRTIQTGITYKMKHRVEDLPENKTKFSVKLWPSATEEPASWDLIAVKDTKDQTSGSALLVAHFTEVTFGDITITPIDP